LPVANDLRVKLSEEALDFVNSSVSSGEYATESEVVSAGVEMLKEHVEERSRWEREVVVAAHDFMMSNPSSALTGDEVDARLAERRLQRRSSL
jgi:antitoxin ParD1/3/4